MFMRNALALTGLISFASLIGCAEPKKEIDSTFGDTLRYNQTRQAIDARVEIDGTNFVTRLEITGHKGEKMEVRIIGDNGRLLGFKYAVPEYDDCVWEKFSIFVPHDRLRGMRPDSGFDLYVVDPADLAHYVGAVRYDKSNLRSPEILWGWVEYQDGVLLSSGERGMTITMSLQIDGKQGQTFRTFAVVSDLQMHPIDVKEGGPIKIPGPRVSADHASSLFDKLTFEIPYSRLKKLPSNARVKITPSIEMGEETIQGNVHFSSWAGGTTDEVRQAVSQEAKRYSEEADRLGKQIEALQKEIGK